MHPKMMPECHCSMSEKEEKSETSTYLMQFEKCFRCILVLCDDTWNMKPEYIDSAESRTHERPAKKWHDYHPEIDGHMPHMSNQLIHPSEFWCDRRDFPEVPDTIHESRKDKKQEKKSRQEVSLHPPVKKMESSWKNLYCPYETERKNHEQNTKNMEYHHGFWICFFCIDHRKLHKRKRTENMENEKKSKEKILFPTLHPIASTTEHLAVIGKEI